MQPNTSLLGHMVVDLSVVSEIVDGQVHQLKFWLRSKSIIAAPLTYVTANGLVDELWAKAGAIRDDSFTLYTLVSSTTTTTDYVYELTLGPQVV